MNQNAPKRKIGKINNVNFTNKTSVIPWIPINFINEKVKVGTIKYRTNLGKKNSNPTKSWSKILPNLLCTMLSKKFLMLVSFHQTI